jgi:hypothetical protein
MTINFDKDYFKSMEEFYIVYDVEIETVGEVYVKVYDVVFEDFLSAKNFVASKLDEKYKEAIKIFDRRQFQNNYYYDERTVDLPLKNHFYFLNNLFDYKIFVKKINNCIIVTENENEVK